MPDKSDSNPRKPAPVKAILGSLALIAYFGLIQWAWGWEKILQQWQSWSLQATLACLAGMFITYLLRALRIRDYYRRESGTGYLVCLRITLFHNLANNLLPMRSGEASFPLLIRAWFGVSATQASGTLLLFRLLDLYSLAVICLCGWLWVQQLYLPLLPSLAAALLVPLALFPAKPLLEKQLQQSDKKPALLIKELLKGAPTEAIDLVRCQLISLINWAIKILVFGWILISFGGLDGFQAILGALGGELSSILPLHAPVGVGTYEAGVVAGALLGGAEAGSTLGAAVNLHILIILGTLSGGLLALALPSSPPPGETAGSA